MSDLIFKLNNPLIISASTGVSAEAGGVPFVSREFDGIDNQTIKLSIPQDVSTTSDVNFNAVTLAPETLTIGTGSRNLFTISESRLDGWQSRCVDGTPSTRRWVALGRLA